MDSRQNLTAVPTNPFLQVAAIACFAASLAHLAIIIGGPDWYRWFGAGEAMAQMAEQGLWYPALLTLAISLLLLLWGFYGLAAAGGRLRLPLCRIAVLLIALIFLARGSVGGLVMAFSDDPYFQELQQRPLFLLVSSAICLAIGSCFLIGLRQRWHQLR